MAHRKTKRPFTLLRGYSMMLQGISELEILNKGVRMEELAKIQHFHDGISQSRHYITVAYENSVDIKLAKRLLQLYEQHMRGEQIQYRVKRSQLTYAFKLLLNGYTDDEMVAEGLTAPEIESAKRFLEIAPDAHKMLLHTLGKQFDIGRDSAARLLKLYRDKQAETQLEDMNENRIPITV